MKFRLKAQELLDRTQSLINAFEIRKGTSGWPDDYVASEEITEQYPDLLLDIQMLLFSESSSSPLYVEAMKLNERKDLVLHRYGDSFNYNDFVRLAKLLSKYIQHLDFLAAKD